MSVSYGCNPGRQAHFQFLGLQSSLFGSQSSTSSKYLDGKFSQGPSSVSSTSSCCSDLQRFPSQHSFLKATIRIMRQLERVLSASCSRNMSETVHTEIQNSSKPTFTKRNPHVLPANSLHTFGECEQAFVDTGRFYHSFLLVPGSAVVFGSSQINSRRRADSDLIA